MLNIRNLTMNDAYADDFFAVTRLLLQCAGLWSPRGQHKLVLVLYKIYGVAVFCLDMFFTASEFVSLCYTYKNEYDLLKNIGFALTHLMGATKAIMFYFRKDKFLEIMNSLESEEFHYESCEEKDFFPGLTSKKYKKKGITFIIMFFIIGNATLALSYVPLAISTLWLIYTNNESHILYKLPYHSWTPIKFNTARTYFVALSFQATPMFSYVYVIVGMDTLFMSIMHLIACNLTIIQGAFTTIRSRAVKRVKGPICNDSEELKLILHQEMRKISHHLQTIYRVCEDLEQVHKYLTLAQMTASLLILCSCLYLVSMTPVTSETFSSESMYMVAVAFQLILYCWFGNEVTLKAAEIPLSIWQCEWIETDNAFKKDMLMTMTRAMKPVFLTVGNFAPLTLRTFLGIVKASYSFFTVIKTTGSEVV